MSHLISQRQDDAWEATQEAFKAQRQRMTLRAPGIAPWIGRMIVGYEIRGQQGEHGIVAASDTAQTRSGGTRPTVLAVVPTSLSCLVARFATSAPQLVRLPQAE